MFYYFAETQCPVISITTCLLMPQFIEGRSISTTDHRAFLCSSLKATFIRAERSTDKQGQIIAKNVGQWREQLSAIRRSLNAWPWKSRAQTGVWRAGQLYWHRVNAYKAKVDSCRECADNTASEAPHSWHRCTDKQSLKQWRCAVELRRFARFAERRMLLLRPNACLLRTSLFFCCYRFDVWRRSTRVAPVTLRCVAEELSVTEVWVV